LDHQRDAAGVDVIHLGKVQQNQLHVALGQRLVSAQDRIFRGAGDIALEAQDDDRMPGRGSELVNVRFGFALHDRFSPYHPS
jgi:hypothetical protein